MSIMEVTVDGVSYEIAPLDPPQSEKPSVGFLAITPTTAERWLKFNKTNRTLRERSFNAQMRDMQNGNWAINGESIKISRPLGEGEVEELPKGSVLFLDGQHRLEACIESGQPFVTVVVWGLEPESRNTMDTGISRTMADVLKMGREVNAPVVASILRRYWMWERGDHKFNGKTRPTHAEMLDLLEKERDAIHKAAEMGYWVRTLFRDVAPSIVGFAYLLCAKVSPEDAPWFFSRLRDGAELPADSPVLALRNRLSRERQERRTTIPEHQLALVLKGWNYYRENRQTTKIPQTPDDPMPMPK
jgi:hypothetical protein